VLKIVNVLIIEDDHPKADAIHDFIRDTAGSSVILNVKRAETLSAAVQLITEEKFDLVTLDLMLPYIDGLVAEASAGLELLKHLRRKKGKNADASIIGLSAFREEAGKALSRFVEAGVVIAEYDEGNHWKSALKSVFETAVARKPAIQALDFVVLVALDSERAGFEETKLLTGSKEAVSGMNVTYVELPGARPWRGAVVRCRQMGLVPAVLETCLAIKTFNPRVVAMSGICAGMEGHSELGQLIFAASSWEYQAGKWAADGFEIAPYQVPLRSSTRAIIEQISENEQLVSSLEAGLDFKVRRPGERHRPKLAPFATGSAVIADKTRLEHVQVQHRKLAAVDMEIYGVFFACHESLNVDAHYFAVKCVVDKADSAKGDDLHRYGAITSARAVVDVLEALRQLPGSAE